jgi:hypothetical protein
MKDSNYVSNEPVISSYELLDLIELRPNYHERSLLVCENSSSQDETTIEITN